jgi:hypothetical protein
MKKLITKLKAKKGRSSVIWLLLLVMGLLPMTGLSQAITSPDPYCRPTYQFQNGPCDNSWGFRLQRVQLANLDYWEPNCLTSVTTTYRFFKPPVADRATLIPGNNYVVNVTTGTGNINTQHSVGVWIDLNNNGVFDASEFLSTGNNLGQATAPAVFSRNLSIPCGTPSGTFRMRVSMNYGGSFTAGAPCAVHNYGETWDFEVEIPELAKIPTPDFTFPANVYVGNPFTVINTTIGRAGNFEWDLDLDGYERKTIDYPLVFNVSGTRFLKLRITGCGEADSVVKAINVQNPTVAPRADFYVNRTVVEEFDEIVLSDLSAFGPSNWFWEIFDPLDNFGFSSQNSNSNGTAVGFGGRKNRHMFEMNDMGFFNVRLTATNAIGSNARLKQNYIEVVPFSEFRLGNGPTETELGKGTIFDKDGPDALYRTGRNGDPAVNRLRITPCGAITITMRIERLKLASADHNFKVWDGPNPAFGKPLHPPGGFTSLNTTTPFEIVATSGAFYMELDTEKGTARDSGLIAYFETDYGVTGPPAPSIGIGDGQLVAYTGAITTIRSTSKNIFGIPKFSWEVDFNPVSPINLIDEGKGFVHVFNTAGTYEVCMEIETCSGDAFYCDDITVVDPTSPTEVDFVSNKIRPDAFEPLIITSKTDKANRFKWDFDPPGRFNFQVPFNANSREIRGSFTEPGAYTVTLTAWNNRDSALTGASVTKTDYIVVVDYCKPSAQIVSGDVGLRNVRLTRTNDGSIVLNQNTTTGLVAYESFTGIGDDINMMVGATYNITLSRASNADPVSHAVFIDYNGDGRFSNDERVLRVIGTNSITTSATFKVPDIDASYTLDPVIMRVVTSYQSEEPSACGPLLVGEYEDYLVQLNPYPFGPTLVLNGSDTMRVEQGGMFNDPGALAMDMLEGNISNRIVQETDLDVSQTGIYFIRYCVSNASGLTAPCVTRTVIVTVDLTPPVLTLSGANPDTIDVLSGTYVDPGYAAFDAVDGDVTATVVVSSNLNENVLGTYTISYTALDLQDNEVTKTRTVVVVDRMAPVINFVGTDKIELGNFWFDQTSVTDNYWPVNQINFTKSYGFNGPVRWDSKGNYTVHYRAEDGSGNVTTATRNYTVDDFTPPQVNLRTSDTVIHDVNTKYTSVQPIISDNMYASNELVVDYTTNLNQNVIGLYVETYRVTDGSGNTTAKSRWIRVIDRIAPVLSAPSFCTKVGFDFNPLNTLTVSDNYYSTEVLMPLIQMVSSNVNPFIQGFYTASFEVTDPSGNRSLVAVQNVQVSENCEMITGVQDVQSGSVRLFPNPSSSLFHIDLSQSVSDISHFDILDNLGSVIKTVNVNHSNVNVYSVDMSSYPSGVYFVKVNGNDFSQTLRMILVK